MPAKSGLLERESELATIERILDGAIEGDGGLILIEGEAGAGKTSLLNAARELARVRGMATLRARGGEYERDFPYGVVRQLFEPLLMETAPDGERLSGTAAMAAPVFGPGGAGGAGIDPLAAQHGLYWLAADAAAEKPVALLVDDAQWADLLSLRALAYIARRLDGLPVVLAMTVRVGDLGRPGDPLEEFRRESRTSRIEPPPLSAGAVAALVAGDAGRDSTRRLEQVAFEATAGNPFLLTQLLQTLGSERGQATEADVERIAELAAAGISSSLLARLAGLGVRTIEAARAIAILEPNAETRLVAALAGLLPEEAADACGRMIDARLLADSLPLSFVHPLIRSAVIADLPQPLRASAHARAARLLHEDGAVADTVASHLLLAEPAGDEWVVGELRAAAAAAIKRVAPETAVRYLRRALREPPAEEDRPGVSRELGSALLRANDPDGIDVLLTVRGLHGDPIVRAEIVAELAMSLTLRERGDEAISLLEEAIAEVPESESDFLLFLRGHLLIQIFWGAEQAPDQLPVSSEDDLDLGAPGVRVCLHMTAALGALGLTPIGPALAIAERLSVDSSAIEADAMAAAAPQGVLIAMALNDRRRQADQLFDLVIAAVRRRGAMPGIAGIHGTRAYCWFIDGELREAQADAEIAMQIVGALDMPVPISTWLSIGLRCLTARGDYGAAAALLADSWGGQEAVPGLPGALLLCARGELRLATGRHAEARHDYLAAAERVRWLPFANPEVLGWRTGLAACEAALGNEEEAQRLAGEAVELAREAGGARGLGISYRVQGGVAGGLDAIALLRKASEVLAGTNARLQHAHALVDLGAALRRANHRREAREPLREGLELAHRCGAARLEERARTELAATGARPRKAVLTGVASLTPSELRVARMAAEGMTNREIAQSLTVTAKTIETHMRHVFQKLDVAKRAELGAVLTRG